MQVKKTAQTPERVPCECENLHCAHGLELCQAWTNEEFSIDEFARLALCPACIAEYRRSPGSNGKV